MPPLFARYFPRWQDIPQGFLAFVVNLAQGALRLEAVLFVAFRLLWALPQGRELGLALPVALVVAALFYLHTPTVWDPPSASEGGQP